MKKRYGFNIFNVSISVCTNDGTRAICTVNPCDILSCLSDPVAVCLYVNLYKIFICFDPYTCRRTAIHSNIALTTHDYALFK